MQQLLQDTTLSNYGQKREGKTAVWTWRAMQIGSQEKTPTCKPWKLLAI